jgi:broad specificity phosphatase PhoE
MIYLVRHAQPAVRRKVAPDRWELTADGRSAAARLAGRLPWDPYLVASDEPKAIQTLHCAYPGRAVDTDPRFGEVRRVEPVDDGYAERRRRYVSGTPLPRWELASAVVARFAAAVTDHLARADGRPLVIGTHGMALTVWLAAALPTAPPADPTALPTGPTAPPGGPDAPAGGPTALPGGPTALAGGQNALSDRPATLSGGPNALAGGPNALAGGPAEFWAALTLPDVLAVDLATATVVRQEG